MAENAIGKTDIVTGTEVDKRTDTANRTQGMEFLNGFLCKGTSFRYRPTSFLYFLGESGRHNDFLGKLYDFKASTMCEIVDLITPWIWIL